MGFWVANLGPQYTPLLSGISDMDQSYILHNWVCSRHQQVFPAVIGIVQYTSNVSLSLFRFVAVGRKLVVVCTLGTCTLIMNILLGGFIVAQNDIEPFMIWGYYISPVMYGQNALVINEFLDKRWSAPNPDPRIHAPTVGKVLLKSRGFFTDDYMFWVCVGALLGFSLLFNILFIAALTFLNPLSDSKSIVLDEDVGKKNKKSSGRMTSEGFDMMVRNASQGTDSSVGVTDHAPRKGMLFPFQPLSLAFNHINYYVDMPTVCLCAFWFFCITAGCCKWSHPYYYGHHSKVVHPISAKSTSLLTCDLGTSSVV